MEKIKLVLYCPKCPPLEWKCPKRFKLGMGLPWECSGSKDDTR